ncbi:MAG TPA: NUDIX domain-containing protein [Patescibacteria group bacterium]|nr:NUDIX domain-containing protein [Patescibacteria group bacterium]
MSDRLHGELKKLIKTRFVESEVASSFLRRLQKGKFSRDENPLTHFCVYFAAFDPKTQNLFLGHHIKSGKWLFNGGHIDEGETTGETLEREVGEEWGLALDPQQVIGPSLLTITTITRPSRVRCLRHYDIWYFISLQENLFRPDQEKLAIEFYTTGWTPHAQSLRLVNDPSTLTAIEHIRSDLFL